MALRLLAPLLICVLPMICVLHYYMLRVHRRAGVQTPQRAGEINNQANFEGGREERKQGDMLGSVHASHRRQPQKVVVLDEWHTGSQAHPKLHHLCFTSTIDRSLHPSRTRSSSMTCHCMHAIVHSVECRRSRNIELQLLEYIGMDDVHDPLVPYHQLT